MLESMEGKDTHFAQSLSKKRRTMLNDLSISRQAISEAELAFLLPVCTFAGIFVTLGLYKNKSSQTTKKDKHINSGIAIPFSF